MSEPTTSKLTFEQALADLEKTVRALEDGQTGLEEALAHYEQGVGLLKHCYGLLRHAEQRILLLTGEDAEGKPLARPFDHAASIELGRAEPRRKRPKADD